MPPEPDSLPRERSRSIWRFVFGGVALLLAGGVVADWYSSYPIEAHAEATYVGRQSCINCHRQEYDQWHGSHHDRAMEIASSETVLGDFNDKVFERLGVTTRFFLRDGKYMVNTEGPDGTYQDFEIKYTFGVDPLQQYMVEFPDGRVQVLRVSWDTLRKEWFEVPPPDVLNEWLAPDDPLHWTGIGQNWNTTCAECHSTNLQKNYDLETDTYRTTFSEIDVSCEECHGPGSLHVELATKRSLFWDRNHGYGLANLKSADTSIQIDTCAKCHSRRHQIHADFRPGRPVLDYFDPSLLHEGLYHADGQILDEVYEYGSFMQSKMHAKGVRCTDCHNPHSLKLKFEGNRLCAQCHEPAKYDAPAHHHHPIGSTGTKCVECHMPATTYMVVDPRRDHSFRVPRPDLTVEVGIPNTCNNCHQKPEETPQWAADQVRKWYGPKRNDDPHWASAFAAARSGKPEGADLLADLVRRRETPAIVKATAVELIGQYDTELSRTVRVQALEDSHALVRSAAVQAVTPESFEQLAELLAPRLEDRSRLVRIQAAVLLAGVPSQLLTSDQRTARDAVLQEYRGEQALSLERAASHLNLADLDRTLGRPDKAIGHLRNAIGRESYLTGPRSELASLLAESGGDPAEVVRLRKEELELFKRDVQLLPDSAVAFYRLGLMQILLGQVADAEQSLSKAAELGKFIYDYHMALALLQERRFESDGNRAHADRAIATLKKMNELRPNDPQTNEILRRIVERRENREGSATQ
ncbi:MAG: cytochrome c3 family protein [Pirellulales bacterium]